MNATGKCGVQIFNVAQHLAASAQCNSSKIKFPIFTTVVGHPEICIHGYKWKWNNQEERPAVPAIVIDVQWRGESDI